MSNTLLFTVIFLGNVVAILLGLALGVKLTLSRLSKQGHLLSGRGYGLIHIIEQGDYEDVKIIGFFSSKEKIEAAKKFLQGKEGFRDAPNGFHTEPYVVDQVYWEDGFCTIPDEKLTQ